MKFTTKYTPIAIALTAILASPLAMADNDNDSLDLYIDAKINARADLALSTSEYKNETSVKIKKESNIKRDVDIEGEVTVSGNIPVGSSSAALVSQNQNNNHNDVENSIVDNNAVANGNAMSGGSGNIGLNITAGDNNFQDNSAALSKVDAAFVFADAETIANQNAEFNTVSNHGTNNTAGLAGSALMDATGNIGVNVSAGNSNLQTNSLAAAVNTSGTMAEATVSSLQTGDHNSTHNHGKHYVVKDATWVTMYGGVSNKDDVQGTYVGTSDQIGDVYPDTWTGDTHPDGTQTGHFDLDTDTQGGSDLNGDGGALAFNDQGTVTFEAGDLQLKGAFTGLVVNTHTVFRPHENNATLGGNAMSGASGNIGVNIAAGTNNLQGNHLSIAAATGNGTTPPGGGGGGEQ